MNVEKINNSPKKLKILVAPLDWGLGHATRCIPIIYTLLKHNTDVILAASGASKTLLENEFPELKILELKGYNIRYTKYKKLFLLNLITQLPKLFSAIRNEKEWLENIIHEEKIDGVISDNRPGLHHLNISCVYITHQLQIQTGIGLSNTWLRNLHYSFISKFDQCWIPDNETAPILGGDLSHPMLFPNTAYKYLGLLSRFQKKQSPIIYDFLLMISGPEPQRSIFEKKLLKAFDNSEYTFALVRGLPAGNNSVPVKTSAAQVFNHLNASELNDVILQSKTVVARAGYSTIMDLAKLQKRAVLVATPGQTEQEYLAKYLDNRKIFACLSQEDISLENIKEANAWAGFNIPAYESRKHESVITKWLGTLAHGRPAM